jgi:hypothetical protein
VTSSSPNSKPDVWPAAVFGLVALLPVLVYHPIFAQLFWFGDEFDLIDQIDKIGFGHWAWQVFAENFVPFFKLLWGGSVFVFGGSYAAMIAIVWITHAFNTYLLGRLLRVAGFGWTAIIFTQLVFGLSPTNIETLGWSVQWSAVLATTFMLFALLALFKAKSENTYHKPALLWGEASYSFASALSFSRGVLTGALLAFDALIFQTDRLALRFARAIAWIFPAVLTAVLIAVFANGNQSHMSGHAADICHYALCFLFLNPFRASLGYGSTDWTSVLGFGLLKLALVGWALFRARGTQRNLLILLIVYDLGNATLLGIGRFHTGFDTSTSSRYQYSSLLVMLPFLGFCLASLLERLPARFQQTATAIALIAISGWVSRGWKSTAQPFCDSRGAASRHALLTDPTPGPFAVPGIPFMSTERGKELIQKYHLH